MIHGTRYAVPRRKYCGPSTSPPLPTAACLCHGRRTSPRQSWRGEGFHCAWPGFSSLVGCYNIPGILYCIAVGSGWLGFRRGFVLGIRYPVYLVSAFCVVTVLFGNMLGGFVSSFFFSIIRCWYVVQMQHCCSSEANSKLIGCLLSSFFYTRCA